MFRKIVFGLVILAGIVFLLSLFWKRPSTPAPLSDTKIRYVSLGDSYSNGEGASADAAWPVLLTKHLQRAGHDIELVANPSVSGFTTRDVIDRELPQFIEARPNFATLMIGANDSFQETSAVTFHKNLQTILDVMQANMPDKKKIVLITIPDYSVTPQAVRYLENPENTRKEIETFNMIIKEEGEKRDLPVVDIFTLTQGMGKETSLVSHDGLHPSAKELELWEEKIFPVVDELLKN
jgi:acyl-CoA thioesterase I